MDDVGSQKLAKAISAVVMALMFGFVGFVDDLIKVKKKQNEGLKPMQKIIMQVLIIAAFLPLTLSQEIPLLLSISRF